MSYATRFQNFERNLQALCEKYGLSDNSTSIPREIQKELKEFRKRMKKLDREFGRRDHKLLFQRKLLKFVRDMSFFEGAVSELSSMTVDSLERSIVEKAQESYSSKKAFIAVFNPLFFYRAPGRDGVDEVDQILDSKFETDGLRKIDFNVILSDDEPSSIIHESPSEFARDDRSLLSIFEGARTKVAYSKTKYPELIGRWRDRFALDDKYYQEISDPVFIKTLRKLKRHDAVDYIQDRFLAFFSNDEGYWDISTYFLSAAESLALKYSTPKPGKRTVPFDDDEWERIQESLINLRGRMPCLTLMDWKKYKSVIEHKGHIRKAGNIHTLLQDRVDILSERQNGQEEVYKKVSKDCLLPRAITSTHAIPKKKPGWLRWDRRRQYKMSRTMSVATIIQDASNQRIKKLSQQGDMPYFDPTKAILVLKDALKNCKFLEEHYQHQRDLWEKTSIFNPGSKHLGQSYHLSVLQTNRENFQIVSDLFETMTTRFKEWAKHPEQVKKIPSRILKRYQGDFQRCREEFCIHQSRFNDRFIRAGQKHSVEIAPITAPTMITSQDIIIPRLKRAFKKSVSEPKKAQDWTVVLSEAPDIETTIDERTILLEQLISGDALEPSALAVLCDNDPESLVLLRLDRTEPHELLKQRCAIEVERILEMPSLFEQRRIYFEQVLKYYYFIGEERLYKNVRDSLVALQEEPNFQKSELGNRLLKSFLYKNPDYKEERNIFRQQLQDNVDWIESRWAMAYDRFQGQLKTIKSEELQKTINKTRFQIMKNRWFMRDKTTQQLTLSDDANDALKGLKSTVREALISLVLVDFELKQAEEHLSLFDERSGSVIAVSDDYVKFLGERAWKLTERSPLVTRRHPLRAKC